MPTTAVCFSGDGAQVFVGGIDNEIQVSSEGGRDETSSSLSYGKAEAEADLYARCLACLSPARSTTSAKMPSCTLFAATPTPFVPFPLPSLEP